MQGRDNLLSVLTSATMMMAEAFLWAAVVGVGPKIRLVWKVGGAEDSKGESVAALREGWLGRSWEGGDSSWEGIWSLSRCVVFSSPSCLLLKNRVLLHTERT